MTSFEYWSFGLGALSWTYWAGAVWAASKLAAGVRAVDDLPLLALPRWPTLSIVIPACNEGATLGAALTARLADDYPGLEIIVVDDRSTDATGSVADEIAARDPRVRVVHLGSLPDGWLGKLHAMQRGCELATGEYLLLSDADTHWVPGTLRRIVARCEARALDHLAVFPTMWSSGLVLDAATATLTRMLMIVGRPWAVPDPRSSAALGVGAFNLVRRAGFARTGGFEWLRLEVADDVGLADMMKRSGGRSEVLRGGEFVGMHLYTSVHEYARSAEKSAVLFGFRAWPALLGAAASLVIECAPLLLVLLAGGVAWWLSATALLLAAAATTSMTRTCGQRLAPALLFPIGGAMTAWAMVRAGVLGRLQGGLRWRTTFYPAAQLLAGRRYNPT